MKIVWQGRLKEDFCRVKILNAESVFLEHKTLYAHGGVKRLGASTTQDYHVKSDIVMTPIRFVPASAFRENSLKELKINEFENGPWFPRNKSTTSHSHLDKTFDNSFLKIFKKIGSLLWIPNS